METFGKWRENLNLDLDLRNNVHALHVKVAFFHTLVIHACVLYSTSRLRTADLREMKAYTSIAPFQSTADS